MQVIKRDGTKEEFNSDKIFNALNKAFEACGYKDMQTTVKDMIASMSFWEEMTIEDIQDEVEETLLDYDYDDVYKCYVTYRESHKQARFVQERLAYMSDYSKSTDNAATSSETDANANITMKNVANLEAEVYKTTNRIIQRQRMKDQLKKDFPEVAKQYEEDLDNHIIYTHDEASTPVPKHYCMAVSLYPFLEYGTSTMDGLKTTPPHNLNSFCGQFGNLVFLLSSQCKGAVGFAEFFNVMDYYCVKEWGEEYHNKGSLYATSEYTNNSKTISQQINQCFQQIVYTINQSASNRGYQSPFVNFNYFDSYYWHSLFGEFRFPDGSQPKWERVSYLQKKFMRWFNKERTKTLLTYPVESLCLLNDGKDYLDKEYKNLAAQMWSEGHSFFVYTSDNADSVASCCFSKDTKFLWKSSTAGVNLTTFEEFTKLPYTGNKENLKIFHNGSWVDGKIITLPNRPMYKVTTYNHKEFIMTDNHINVTLHGEKPTEQLTTDDYLLFNTARLNAIPENNEHLTYAQGYVIGSFLGAGSFGSEIKGTIYDINLSQNEQKYKRSKFYWNLALRQMGLEQRMTLGEIINNVYPLRVSSKELAAFIIKWTKWFRGTYAYNKKLNMNALLQSVKFREGILQGWYDGGNSNRCYTTSPELAENMEALITSLGMQSIIDISDRIDEKVIIRGEEYKRNYPLYCVRWYEDTNHRLNKAHNWIKFNNGVYFRIKSIEKYDYSDKVYCIECKNASEPYFTLPSGLITHNCRLRNDIKTFTSTTGLTGIEVGSCNVITLNMNRIVQNWVRSWNDYKDRIDTEGKCNFPLEWLTHEDFKNNWKKYLTKILVRVLKYHIAYKNILYDWESRKMITACNSGYIHMNKLYSTYGINGINEMARFLGLEVSNNKDYYDFAAFTLGCIKEFIDKHNQKRFMLNLELVPAEALGVKNYNWDKSDGYWVPSDENLYNSYIYNAHDSSTSVLDRFYLQGGAIAEAVSGGY